MGFAPELSAWYSERRLNGIDLEAYLRHILSLLQERPFNKMAEFLPWDVNLANI